MTFFYPSTEWDMAQGFDCGCGAEVSLRELKDEVTEDSMCVPEGREDWNEEVHRSMGVAHSQRAARGEMLWIRGVLRAGSAGGEMTFSSCPWTLLRPRKL